MTVAISRAIWFECEHCGHGQYDDYEMADHIDCEKCGKENMVIEEM